MDYIDIQQFTKKKYVYHFINYAHLNYPPIDVVYTWVNGSDPVWFKQYQQLKKQFFNTKNPDDNNQSTSINRFRSNDELKY